jgi:hypothetical protein
MTKVREDAMGRTLRWMEENLMGAYNAVHPEGHRNAGTPCTNSGTIIIACCYVNALGKVLLKGGPHKRGGSSSESRDYVRFREFLHLCMSDFLVESSSIVWPATPKGRSGGDGWLYEIYRCGLVHGYPGANVAWGRYPSRNTYWQGDSHSRLTLNIDELVRGFLRGLVDFRCRAATDDVLRSRFNEFIVA